MKAKRGISPIIATVILIAVTIAIAGWLMGVWGGMGGAESLKIYPNATLQALQQSQTKLNLTVKNEGSKDARIIEVRVDGLGKASCQGVPLTVQVGRMLTLSCTINNATVPGATYTVRVMTEAGNTYLTQVTATG